METKQQHISEFIAQRDELVAALDKACAFFDRYGFPVAAKAVVEEIRAALAKVRVTEEQ